MDIAIPLKFDTKKQAWYIEGESVLYTSPSLEEFTKTIKDYTLSVMKGEEISLTRAHDAIKKTLK